MQHSNGQYSSERRLRNLCLASGVNYRNGPLRHCVSHTDVALRLTCGLLDDGGHRLVLQQDRLNHVLLSSGSSRQAGVFVWRLLDDPFASSMTLHLVLSHCTSSKIGCAFREES